MRYLDPKADLTFKKIFGEHKDLLISLLNALLPLADDEQIESVEYLSPELVPETYVGKNSIVDVRCRDVKGRQFIVEMQMLWTGGVQAARPLQRLQSLRTTTGQEAQVRIAATRLFAQPRQRDVYEGLSR